MTDRQEVHGAEIRAAERRRIARTERRYGELYRRERDRYAEWIDLGGEGGEA